MIVLGIETTCDETAAAIVKDGNTIYSNVISSQIDIHQQYGGVFPEVASRCHVDMIIPVIEDAVKQANITHDDIDLIAVAHGPGLIGSILIGLTTAKTLSMAWNKPLIGVNHVEAHLYSSMIGKYDDISFPLLGVVLSGGHTEILEVTNIGEYRLIGKTIDDAIGESFDKVASMLGLPYPGGPAIEKLAKTGDSDKYKFTAGSCKNNIFNFSFSGIKTQVLYKVKGNMAKKHSPTLIEETDKKDIAASFQKIVFTDVLKKTAIATEQFPYNGICFGGGVTNSSTLRSMAQKYNFKVPLYWPEPHLSLDNAVMIAALGYHKFKNKGEKSDGLDIIAHPRLSLV
jgi:N6-L-threonylcarbamoyladenine synthase